MRVGLRQLPVADDRDMGLVELYTDGRFQNGPRIGLRIAEPGGEFLYPRLAPGFFPDSRPDDERVVSIQRDDGLHVAGGTRFRERFVVRCRIRGRVRERRCRKRRHQNDHAPISHLAPSQKRSPTIPSTRSRS